MLLAEIANSVGGFVDQNAGGATTATEELRAIFLGREAQANGLGVVADRAHSPVAAAAKSLDVGGVIDRQCKPALLLGVVSGVIPTGGTPDRLADVLRLEQIQFDQLTTPVTAQPGDGVAIGQHHLLGLLAPVVAGLPLVGRGGEQGVGRMIVAVHHVATVPAHYMKRELGHVAR